MAETAWPVKRRELHNHHFDSTVWNGFPFRDGDIVVSTYAKSGTTWMQQIVGQLVFAGAADVDVGTLSPWVDLRVPPKDVKLPALEAQVHRRFLKTHLPVDALVFSPKARYVYVARDGRDVVWSLHNHHTAANATWYAVLNDTPGLVGPRIGPPNPDIRQYFLEWLQWDGYPFWSMWENVRSWWAIRHLPNVMLVHYNDLKRDLPGSIRGIADFLGIEVPPEKWPAIVEHSTFEYMKRNAAKVAPLGGSIFEGGAERFVYRGTNGRWRDVLTAEDCRRYEATAREKLGDDCAMWLTEGGPVSGASR